MTEAEKKPTPIGTRLKGPHGSGVVKAYEILATEYHAQVTHTPDHQSYRLLLELEPGQTWQTTKPELLYAIWESEIEEVLSE
jgi:hypothetical protein